MADSIDQKIELTADTSGGEAIEKTVAGIGRESSEAAKHAVKLMKVIAELKQQLDGMNSEAAVELKAELSDLAKVINTLDIERLKHLDGILANLEKTGAKITGDGVQQVHEEISEIKKEAADFWQSFRNDYGINIKVKAESDELETLAKQIEAAEDANDLVGTLHDIGEEAKSIDPENAAALTAQLEIFRDAVSGLSPDSVDAYDAAYERLLATISRLPTKARAALSSLKIETLKNDVESLRKSVTRTADDAEDAGSMVGLANTVLSGNLDGIGNRLTSLIQKTKLWKGFSDKIGFGRAAATIGLVTVGIQAAMTMLKGFVEEWQKAKVEAMNSGSEYVKQTVEMAGVTRESRIAGKERTELVGDAATETERAKRDNARAARRSELEARKWSELAGTTNPEERRRIEVKYDRDIATMDYDTGVIAQKDTMADRKRTIARLEAEAGINAKEKRSVDSAVKSSMANLSARQDELSRFSALNSGESVGGRLMDMVGLTTNLDDLKEAVKNAEEAQKSALERQRELAQRDKDLAAKIEAQKKALEQETTVINRLTAARNAELAEQKAADEQRRRERNATNRDRMYAEEDRKYDEREAVHEIEMANRRRAGSYVSEIAGAEYKLNRYEEDHSMSRAALAAFYSREDVRGKDEASLSEEQKAERDRLERIELRDRSNVRNARSALADLKSNRDERIAEWKEGIGRQGNRLTAMGLGGDTASAFSKQTAGNTKMLVELTKTLVQNSTSWARKPGNIKEFSKPMAWGM